MNNNELANDRLPSDRIGSDHMLVDDRARDHLVKGRAREHSLDRERTMGDASADPHGRSADEIQSEIERTRSQLDETLSALQHKLSPSYFVDEARTYVRDHSDGLQEFAHNFTESVRRNPMPVALTAIGIAWLMVSGRRGGPDTTHIRH